MRLPVGVNVTLAAVGEAATTGVTFVPNVIDGAAV
jgi:hypothetical protein